MRAEGGPGDGGGGGSSDEEDEALLAALAQQADAFGTPFSLALSQQHQGQQEDGSQTAPGSPPASQQEATLARAQSALQQLLASTQKECEDILSCSSQQERGGEEEEEEEHGQKEQQQQQPCCNAGNGEASFSHLAGAGQQVHPAGFSPLPFSLSPGAPAAAAATAAAVANAAAGGDIEDLGGTQEDAVYLQAMHNFEQLGAAQQQPVGQSQEQRQQRQQRQQQPVGQSQEQRQQRQQRQRQQPPPSPTIPQTDGQCDSAGGCASGIPQVDGSTDSIDSPSNSEVSLGVAHVLFVYAAAALRVALSRAADRPVCAMLRAGAALPDIAPAAAVVSAAVPVAAAAAEEG